MYLTALAVAAPAEAQTPERLTLRWEAPAGCPPADAVRAEVARLLGGAVPPDGVPVAAEARAQRDGDRYVLELRTEVDGAGGERTLDAPECEELVSAAALILALMIDPEVLSRVEAAPITTPPGRQLDEPRARAVPSAEPARDPITTRVGAAFVLDLGTLPALAPGLRIEVGLGTELLEGRLRATLVLPQGAVNDMELPGASAELTALVGGLLGCVRPIEGFRALGLCAELEAGAVFGSAQGISVPRFGAGLFLAGGGGVALTWEPTPWLALELMAIALGQIAAPAFDVIVGSPTGERRVVFFEPPGATGRLSLGSSVRF